MLTETLEREYDVLDKEIPEKQSQSFSEENYYGFIKKPELTKNWLYLFLLFDEILEHKKLELTCFHSIEAILGEKETEVQKINDKHLFKFGKEFYEIEIGRGIPQKIKDKSLIDYYWKNTKDLNSWLNIPDEMITLLENLTIEEVRNLPQEQKEYYRQDLREKLKDYRLQLDNGERKLNEETKKLRTFKYHLKETWKAFANVWTWGNAYR